MAGPRTCGVCHPSLQSQKMSFRSSNSVWILYSSKRIWRQVRIHIYLDEYETQAVFKERNDTPL